jgi:hypothetical protein
LESSVAFASKRNLHPTYSAHGARWGVGMK